MREVVIQSWCDVCWLDGGHRVPRTTTYTVGITAGEFRPALHAVEVCDAHVDVMSSMVELAENGSLLDNLSAPAKPFKPRLTPVAIPQAVEEAVESIADEAPELSDGSGICPVCLQDLKARNALIGHVWARHRPEGRRMPAPTSCPDCGYTAATPQQVGSHRMAAHNYDALAEVLAGVPGFDNNNPQLALLDSTG